MKKIVIITSAIIFSMTLRMFAQEAANDSKYDEVKIKASMTCNSCKESIEKNIAFEKGVKDLSVDLETKTVTIKYNTEKTNPEKLEAAIKKLNFETEILKSGCAHNELKEQKYQEVKKCCKKSEAKKCCVKESESK